MATLYIREYPDFPVSQGSKLPAPPEPAVAKQTVSFTGTAGQSSAFNAKTKCIGITADSIFAYEVGSDPTAVTTDFRVLSGTILYLGVQPGQKISAIVNT
jgi:hypothetical protein